MRFKFGALLWLLSTLVPHSAEAGAVLAGTRPWPHGAVPFEIAPSLIEGDAKADCQGWQAGNPAAAIYKVCHAMSEWHMASGVTFVPANGAPDTLEISAGPSTTGTLGFRDNHNRITIKKDDGYGSILHEFGHVLGLMHEHQRPDRDAYIEVTPELDTLISTCDPIAPECRNMRLAFVKLPQTQLQSPYDPCSIMHYPPVLGKAFHQNQSRAFTLTNKGQASLAQCRPKMDPSCAEVGHGCHLSSDDGDVVRRFNLISK